ncbi:hypothetical protein CALCODRAFT_282499 [Calocera cornea HHB12733]|uniref:Uncharacterized protein n=1 Tax=Calocera cornea HHB12733 TaxID=1353952 RepID=A0A165FY16_9BASI|nr:hypothetical protein CALCODRAFT_282499 [Calocera cornea HHB12733]
MFSETPYGRLLEAVQLYLYALYAFVICFYGSISGRTNRTMEKSNVRQRRPSLQTIASFQDVSRPPSVTTPYSYPSPAPLMQNYNSEGASFSRPDPKRRSTAERLSQWVSERVVLSPTGAGRSWLDLERGHKRERSSTDKTIRKPSRTATPSQDKRYYRDEAPSRKPTLDSVNDGPTRKPSTSSQGAGGSVTVVSPTNGGRVALSRSGSSKAQSPDETYAVRSLNRDSSLPPAPQGIVGGRYGTRTKPSILGRPTISRIQSVSNIRSPSPSTDLSVALREQDERDKMVASIVQPRDSLPSQYAPSPHSNSYRSGTSSVSLSNFPSPPPMPMPMPMPTASTSKQAFPKPLRLPGRTGQSIDVKGKGPVGKNDDVVVDDVIFTLAPPNWRRNIDRKVDSYGSAASSAALVKPDQYETSAQWDITSFIGGVVSPTAESAYTPTLASAGPPGRREVSMPYPSALASSAMLSPVRSVAESEDTAQILEVRRTQPITRIMPTLPEKAMAMRAKERSPERMVGTKAADNDVSILPETETSSPAESRGDSPKPAGSRAGTPGKTSPFPTRPLAGLGSLSTGLRSLSPNGGELPEPMDGVFEKPRPAPSPVSTTASPQSRTVPTPGGFF